MSDNNTADLANRPSSTHIRDALTFTPVELPPDHPADFETRREIYARKDVHTSQHSAAPAPDTDWVSRQNPAEIVGQVARQISKMEERLAATSGRFDPATGKEVMQITGHARDALERQLMNLQHTSLPYAKAEAARIAALQATLPTADDRLRAEGEKKARIEARALELADEMEAKAAAERLLAARRKG